MRDTAHAQEVLQKAILPQYALYGYGRWAVHSKTGPGPLAKGFIGLCGRKMRPEVNEIDPGYRFMKEYWGKGFATKTAASLRYGFEKLGIKRIVGRALPANLASIRVLEKCGMTYVGEEMIEGLLHKTYEIFNPLIPYLSR